MTDPMIPGGWSVGDRIGSYKLTAYDPEACTYTLLRFKDNTSVTMGFDEFERLTDQAEKRRSTRNSSERVRGDRAEQRYNRSGWWGPRR